MRTRFSTPEVATLTGASVRQIDYWARTGLLRPSEQDATGRGSRRRYGFRDVVAIRAIQQLRAANCPLQKIRAAVRYLKTHYPDSSSADMLSRLTLLTDGRAVYLSSNERQVMDIVTRQMVWCIPLGKLILDTRESIAKMPTEWTERVRIRGRIYHLDLTQDEETGEFTSQCRELPGAIEQGRTLTEAVASGKDAIESVLDYMERRGQGAARVQAL